jgi:hypothetical protein
MHWYAAIGMRDYMSLRGFVGRLCSVVMAEGKFTTGRLIQVEKELIIVETERGEKHIITDFVRVEVKP